MKCHKCGIEDITHYKQKRVDGVWVVTARCSNGHIPEKGRPFYSVQNFNLDALPALPQQPQQLKLEEDWQEKAFRDGMDYIKQLEARHERQNKLFPRLK